MIDQPTRILCDPGGDLAFVASRTELQVVSLEGGRVRQSIPLVNQCETLTLSPDGRRLVTGSATGEIVVWNVHREPEAAAVVTPSRRLAVHDSAVYDVEFESDGASVLSVGRDGTVRRTNIDEGAALFHELDWARGNVVEPIPDSDFVLVRTPLAIHDRRTGRVVHRLADVSPLTWAVSSEGNFVAALAADAVRVWNSGNGQLVLDDERPRENLGSCCLAFAGEHLHLVVSSRHLDEAQNKFESFSLPDGRRTLEQAHNQTRWMFGCEGGGLVFRQFDPDGVMCLEIPDGRIRWRRPPFQDYAQEAVISRDGRWLVASDGKRHALMLFDCRTGIVKYRVPCDCSVTALAVADDGLSFFVGDSNGDVSVWSLEHGQKLFDLAHFDAPIEALHSTECSVLAAASKKVNDRRVPCWYEFDME